MLSWSAHRLYRLFRTITQSELHCCQCHSMRLFSFSLSFFFLFSLLTLLSFVVVFHATRSCVSFFFLDFLRPSRSRLFFSPAYIFSPIYSSLAVVVADILFELSLNFPSRSTSISAMAVCVIGNSIFILLFGIGRLSS